MIYVIYMIHDSWYIIYGIWHMAIPSYMTYDIHHKIHATSRLLYDVNRIWHQAQPCTRDTSSTDSRSIYNDRLENGAPDVHSSNRKHGIPRAFTTTTSSTESPNIYNDNDNRGVAT